MQASYSLSCRFLVAADGAASRTRKALGVDMIGQDDIQHLVNIHFWAPGLARRLRNERPAMLYFVFNPKAVVVVVAHDLSEGEFVAQVQNHLYFSHCLNASLFVSKMSKPLITGSYLNPRH